MRLAVPKCVTFKGAACMTESKFLHLHCRCRRRQADRAAWAIPGVDGGAVDARALPECGGGSETGAW